MNRFPLPPPARPRRPSALAPRLPSALALVALLAAAVLPGCGARRPPVFEPDRAVGENVLVVQPLVRLGLNAREPDVTVVEDRLLTELRRSLSGRGVTIATGTDPERYGALRQALVEAWARARTQGLGRLRSGMSVDLGAGTAAARESGSGTAVLVVMARSGAVADDNRGVPRAPGEVLENPDDRDDYVIPKAGSEAFSTGVDLELLAVGIGTEQVIAHRRVAYPARTTAEVLDAIPVLVREVSRNLNP